MKLLKKIKKVLTGNYESKTLEEIYLGQSTSLVELERRQKEIDRGEAPWQTRFLR